jgi:hypothetical protein
MSCQPVAVRIESTSEADTAPFEFRFAPSAVSTFPNEVRPCYGEDVLCQNRAHDRQKKMQNLSIRLLLVRCIGSGEFRAAEAGCRSEGKISRND